MFVEPVPSIQKVNPNGNPRCYQQRKERFCEDGW